MVEKRCCILFNQPQKGALPDELDVIDQVEYIEANLKEIGFETYRKGITTDFMKEIDLLSREKPQFVFNLVESINNKGELCYFVPALLNMNSIPYSGNPLEAMFITTSKLLTTKILNEHNIKTPGSFLPSQRSLLVKGRKYIVKPTWEDGSMDISGDSVFIFDSHYEKKLSKYSDSHWIIQEFIEGREFNISILAGEEGPEVMPPAEIVFRNFGEERPRIVDFKAKWIHGSFEYENTIREFPNERFDPVLYYSIKNTALDCWKVFGLKGYARVDMRIDSSNDPFVIEVNANPCISPDSGFVAATCEAKIPAIKVIQRIINDLNT
jgi:D-alanine-D-alanine ligase